MPYKDHDQKLKAMKQWRQRVMAEGYGRWLYARRKLRFQDAEQFREALEQIAIRLPVGSINEEAGNIARDALAASRQREEELGRFRED